MSHATPVLYIIANRANFFFPVSSAIVAMVAMQGKNSSINTRNAAAELFVKSPDAMSDCERFFSSLLYNTPKVLTTSSFAGILAISAILERQLSPNGSTSGSMAFPIIPMYDSA